MATQRLFATIGALLRPSRFAPRLSLPLFGVPIRAGFPSPADDYIEDALDLNDLMIEDQAATFFCRVVGDSMSGAGIFSGDVLVVNRGSQPKHDDIVVAVVDNELTIKKLYHRAGRLALIACNPSYPPIEIRDGRELFVWGVVTGSVRRFRSA
jgi:DNA polymerase V